MSPGLPNQLVLNSHPPSDQPVLEGGRLRYARGDRPNLRRVFPLRGPNQAPQQARRALV